MSDDFEAVIFLPRGRHKGPGTVLYTQGDLDWFVGNLPDREYIVIEYLDGSIFKGLAQEYRNA